MPDLFLFHVERTKPFDARCVDDIAIACYGKHLREGGGVHPLVVIRRDVGGLYRRAPAAMY